MSAAAETPIEHFWNFLFLHRGWKFPAIPTLCDRCAGPDAETVLMAEPLPVPLELCPACIRWIKIEAAKEYSGELGMAGVYALAAADFQRPRPVNPVSRAQRG